MIQKSSGSVESPGYPASFPGVQKYHRFARFLIEMLIIAHALSSELVDWQGAGESIEGNRRA